MQITSEINEELKRKSLKVSEVTIVVWNTRGLWM